MLIKHEKKKRIYASRVISILMGRDEIDYKNKTTAFLVKFYGA